MSNNNNNNGSTVNRITEPRNIAPTTSNVGRTTSVSSVSDLRAMLAEKRRQIIEYQELVREAEVEVETLAGLSASTPGETAILESDVQFAAYSFSVTTDALERFTASVTVL